MTGSIQKTLKSFLWNSEILLAAFELFCYGQDSFCFAFGLDGGQGQLPQNSLNKRPQCKMIGIFKMQNYFQNLFSLFTALLALTTAYLMVIGSDLSLLSLCFLATFLAIYIVDLRAAQADKKADLALSELDLVSVRYKKPSELLCADKIHDAYESE